MDRKRIDHMSVSDLAEFVLTLYHSTLLAGRALGSFAPRVGEVEQRVELVHTVHSLVSQAELLHRRALELRVRPGDLGRPSELAAAAVADVLRQDDPLYAIAWGKALLNELAGFYRTSQEECQTGFTFHDKRLYSGCLALCEQSLAHFGDESSLSVPMGDFLTAPYRPGESVTPTGTLPLESAPCPRRSYPAWAQWEVPSPALVSGPDEVEDADEIPDQVDDRAIEFLLWKNLQIEFIATDVPLRSLADFHDLPLAFYLDMARHGHDELRHTHLLLDGLTEMGIDYRQFPYKQPDLYAAIAGQALDHRLIVLSRTGEDAAIEAFANEIPRVRAAGYEAVGIMLDHTLADELRHVTYANRWLQYLYDGDDLAVEQATERCIIRHNEIVDEVGLGDSAKREPDHMAYRGRRQPNLELRALAGFTERDLQRLAGGQPES